MTGLATVIGVVGWVSVGSINRTLNNITDVSAPTVETSDDLAIGLWEATKVAEEIAASSDATEIDDLTREFGTLIAQFDTAKAELRGLVSDRQMIERLNTAADAQQALVGQATALFALRRELVAAETSIWRRLDGFDVAGAALNERLQALVDANESEMAAAEEEGDRLQQHGATAAEINAAARATPDCKHGISTFLATKKPPRWR